MKGDLSQVQNIVDPTSCLTDDYYLEHIFLQIKPLSDCGYGVYFDLFRLV